MAVAVDVGVLSVQSAKARSPANMVAARFRMDTAAWEHVIVGRGVDALEHWKSPSPDPMSKVNKPRTWLRDATLSTHELAWYLAVACLFFHFPFGRPLMFTVTGVCPFRVSQPAFPFPPPHSKLVLLARQTELMLLSVSPCNVHSSSLRTANTASPAVPFTALKVSHTNFPVSAVVVGVVVVVSVVVGLVV